jgi:HTH-type transcriptional regulator/antitoxin HigA
MKTLKYTRIKSNKQYDEYCQKLEELINEADSTDSNELEDEIELVTILIEKWEEENSSFSSLNPVELLKFLMTEHRLQSKDLAEITGVSPGMISSILNYRKGLSKNTIRKLAKFFKLSQSAFNQPYRLQNSSSQNLKSAS